MGHSLWDKILKSSFQSTLVLLTHKPFHQSMAKWVFTSHNSTTETEMEKNKAWDSFDFCDHAKGFILLELFLKNKEGVCDSSSNRPLVPDIHKRTKNKAKTDKAKHGNEMSVKKIVSTEVNLIQNEVLESITSIPPGIDSFYAESNLIESLLNRNTLIDSSSKIDSLLDEFAGELTLLKSIPPGIDDDNLDPEGEIHLVERLLYDNSSPRPPKELNVENSIESFSPSPIPVEDSDSQRRSMFFLLRMTQYHRVLRVMIMTRGFNNSNLPFPSFESFS
ncbi:hypothetical protein Tco_0528887 [Tanacetum coccineum]